LKRPWKKGQQRWIKSTEAQVKNTKKEQFGTSASQKQWRSRSPKVAKHIEKEIMCRASHLKIKTHESVNVCPTLGMMKLELNIPSKHIQNILLSYSKPILRRRIKLIKEKNTCITHCEDLWKQEKINEYNYWRAIAKVREEGRSVSR
jgi:hypothetical protein